MMAMVYTRVGTESQLKETAMLRVVGYTRVSTEEQGSSGLGLESQVAKIGQYASLYDLDVVEIISDPGVSGKSLDRPGVQAVLAMLRRRKAGSVDGVIVAKLDRLTRSIGDWAALIKEFFRDESKRLFSVGENIDTRSATGRMMLNMIMLIAEWEREVIGERTKDALTAKSAKREKLGGKLRFGYDLDPTTLHPTSNKPYKLVPNASEQAVIRRLQTWKNEGLTLRAMIARLNDQGVRTKEGNDLWKPMSLARILSRPVEADQLGGDALADRLDPSGSPQPELVGSTPPAERLDQAEAAGLP